MPLISESEWKPVSRARFEEILADEVGKLSNEMLLYEAYRIGILEHPCYRSEEYGVERVFVVARREREVLFFDDVEDEWATGVPDDDGVLRKWGLLDTLGVALRSLVQLKG